MQNRNIPVEVLSTGERVRFLESAAGIALTLPPAQTDEPDRVIVLQTGGPRP